MPLSCTVNALLYSLSHNYSPLIAYNCYTCSPILTPSYAFTFFRLVYSNSFCAFTLFYILHYLLNNNCALYFLRFHVLALLRFFPTLRYSASSSPQALMRSTLPAPFSCTVRPFTAERSSPLRSCAFRLRFTLYYF